MPMIVRPSVGLDSTTYKAAAAAVDGQSLLGAR